MDLDKHTPHNIPRRSTTAICASPLAVISPIFSLVPSLKLLYNAFLVALFVNILICLQAFAHVANSKKKPGHKKVPISNPFPNAYNRLLLYLHLFASGSNFLPILLAHTILTIFPNASFSTQLSAADSPTARLPLLIPSERRRDCVPSTCNTAEMKRWIMRHWMKV